MTDISLKPYQEPHFRKIMDIMKNWYVYLDHSNTGSGKTVVTTTVARAMGLDIILIAPPTLHKQWADTVKIYGVRIIMSLSYQKLRGAKSSSKGDRPLLIKNTEDGEYEPTTEFISLLNHGILLVFDEFHNVKNSATQQLDSAHTLVKALINANKVSRCALLSATPGDKSENALSLLKMLGVCSHKDLVPKGIAEILKFAELIDPITSVTLTMDIDTSKLHELKHKQAMNLAYDTYREIFGPCFSSSANLPTEKKDSQIQHLKYNGFFNMPPDDEKLLRETYESLANALHYDGSDESIKMDKSKLGLITKCMGIMEECKIRTIVRIATSELLDIKNPRRKVIIYLNFIKSMERCARLLAEFKPEIMNGDTPTMERDRIREKFQQPNNDLRVIITSTAVGGVGVCFDDTIGTHERTQIFSPSNSFIGTCQGVGRVARASTKSSSKNYLVFCKNLNAEYKLLNSMGRKATTLRDYRATDEEGDLLYPGEYPEYIEN